MCVDVLSIVVQCHLRSIVNLFDLLIIFSVSSITVLFQKNILKGRKCKKKEMTVASPLSSGGSYPVFFWKPLGVGSRGVNSEKKTTPSTFSFSFSQELKKRVFESL